MCLKRQYNLYFHLLYRLTDPFCLFYLTQVERQRRGENFWRDNENSPVLAPWRGHAFEDACLKHVEQIKKAMGVCGVTSDNSAWTLQGIQEQKGMQIDLIIERSDRVINLCEMKFVNTDFEVKEYKATLLERLNWINAFLHHFITRTIQI